MSEMKHTPGPWAYRDAHNNTDAVIVFNPRKGHELAILRNGNEANARLIAATPELLEAAMAFIAPFNGIEVVQDGHIAKARSAIARATGGQL